MMDITRMMFRKNFICFPNHASIILRQYRTTDTNTIKTRQKKISSLRHKIGLKKILQHFKNSPQLKTILYHIPEKHLTSNLKTRIEYLYLADRDIAKDAVTSILPLLTEKAGVICDTNAGLGFITTQLLVNGVKFVRIYESCNQFQELLEKVNVHFPNCVEIYERDLYHLNSTSYADRMDNGNRKDVLLRNIPKVPWNSDPAMTIIGPLAHFGFINYLLHHIVYQTEIIKYGRIQLFTFMKSTMYDKLTSNPNVGIRRYSPLSILFQLFFDWKLLGKYSRRSFVPWDKVEKADAEMYFVQITCKKELPTDVKYLQSLYYFVKQGFKRGKNAVIPTMENWFPGIGLNLIAPPKRRGKNSHHNFNIFTEFGELSPLELVNVFEEMIDQPDFKTSSFSALVDSLIFKYEAMPEIGQDKAKD